MLADFAVALPPLDEQASTVIYLDDRTSKIDALTAESEKFIELAPRTSIGTHHRRVTGQIDVREAS